MPVPPRMVFISAKSRSEISDLELKQIKHVINQLSQLIVTSRLLSQLYRL